ncbi:MAG: PRC-barrel domain-containing protein [Bradyrhizobium sp.]
MLGKLSIILLAFAMVASGAPSRAADEQKPTPSPAAQPPPAAPAKQPPPPPSMTILGAKDAYGVLGRDVRSSKDEDMGHIVDVIVDRTGKVRAAVIDFGGFLGVGSRKIAVDWDALHFGKIAKNRDAITLDLTKAQVAKAPAYKENEPIVVLGAAGRLQPLEEP